MRSIAVFRLMLWRMIARATLLCDATREREEGRQSRDTEVEVRVLALKTRHETGLGTDSVARWGRLAFNGLQS